MRVSQEFRDAIFAPTRRVTGKVAFEFVDDSAYVDNTKATNSEASISRKDQVTNRVRNMSSKWATFEPNYFKLDGSFHIPPLPSEGGDLEVGWWSKSICGNDGTYTTNPYLDVKFTNPHNSIGLSITFDPVANEYASEFTIIFYDASDAVMITENIKDNDKTTFILERTLDNYKRIRIRTTKWSKGNRRARITEVDFGIIKEYEGDKLIRMNVVEEMDLVGNVVISNEMSFTIDNSDRLFNILNPQGFYNFLKQNQKVTGYLGLEVRENEFEYLTVGQYFLTDWQTDEGALTTTFRARDIFEMLLQDQYTNSLTSTNLYALAEDVFKKAGINDYFIDDSLSIISTNGFPDSIGVREALQYIAMAGRCALYQDRFGKVLLERFEPLTISTGYLTFAGGDMYAGVTSPEVDNNYTYMLIDFDNVFAEPKVELADSVKSLVFMVYSGVPSIEVTYNNSQVTGGLVYKIDNPLVISESQASDIADWMFREYNLRANYTANWRQNFSFEIGDVVLIEDSFEQRKRSRIVKQEFRFEGYLEGTTETRGGI